jgi:hypothetical protein
MIRARSTASGLLLVASLSNACRRADVPSAAVLGDSTYVAVIAELQRSHDERARSPMPPILVVPGPNGSAPTVDAQRRRDSLLRHRADSVFRVDSVQRAAIFVRHKVTVAELETTARVLATDPAHVQRINDAVYRRVTALDAAANQAKVKAQQDGARAAAAASKP